MDHVAFDASKFWHPAPDKLTVRILVMTLFDRIVHPDGVDPGGAGLHLRLGQPGEAARELRRVLDDMPDDVDARFYYGEALLAAGDAAGARDAFAAVLAREPQDATARERLAELEGRGPVDAAR